LNVGQSFVSNIALSSCGGRQKVEDTFTWTVSDPTVLEVEAATGLVKARAVGDARVSIRGAIYGGVGALTVTVR
jgi:hypothetical protein